MPTQQNRIEWIDEFKGFVLLLVCLYHLEQSFANVQMGMENLSAFRMSAFFFISGSLFSTRRFSNFKSYAVHKTKVLLLPYIWLSLLFLALDPVVWNFDWFPLAPKMSVMNIRPEIATLWDYIYWNLAKIFVAGKSSIGSGPIWFVFTLYSISLMFYGVHRITRAKPIAIAAVAIASLAGGWLLYKNHIRLPLGIERDLTVLFFFACGWICKKFVSRPKSNVSQNKSQDCLRKPLHPAITAAIAIIAFVLYGILETPNPNFSIMNNDLGKSLTMFIATSLFGIVGLVFAFQTISRLPQVAPLRIIRGIFRNISRNALVILAVHWWILLVLRIVFKQQLDKPGIAYCAAAVVIAGCIAAIPLFRCKLYKLLGKEPISARESLSIK